MGCTPFIWGSFSTPTSPCQTPTKSDVGGGATSCEGGNNSPILRRTNYLSNEQNRLLPISGAPGRSLRRSHSSHTTCVDALNPSYGDSGNFRFISCLPPSPDYSN